MGNTVIEKIIRHNTGKDVKPGDIVTVNVDRVMIHDIFIPFVGDKFEEMGFTKLWDPDKVVLIYDHLVPASQVDDTRHFHKGDEFAKKYGMKNVHRSDGICHQLMTEAGYVKPGDVVFGTDSHTTTYGCVGAFSSGIGYTEMASILGTGTMWIKVPETIKVVIEGELPKNVMSKDDAGCRGSGRWFRSAGWRRIRTGSSGSRRMRCRLRGTRPGSARGCRTRCVR